MKRASNAWGRLKVLEQRQDSLDIHSRPAWTDAVVIRSDNSRIRTKRGGIKLLPNWKDADKAYVAGDLCEPTGVVPEGGIRNTELFFTPTTIIDVIVANPNDTVRQEFIHEDAHDKG